jgi:imidazolonepropionase-like amidohydrolase
MLRCIVRRGALAASIALGGLIAPAAAGAQSQPTHPDLPGGFAITNARIVTVSGGTIASGTIVVDNGIIRAVGANVSVPAGAWTIDGTGMTVYPGLIDAFSTLGHPQPRGGAQGQGGSNGQQEYSWGPEDRPATFTWMSAADEISAGDDRIEKWSDAGFTSAVTTRSQGFFPGRAAVINVNPRADRTRAMVVAPLDVQRINLGSRISSGYPGSLLGSFAYIKQLYEDAAHYDRLWTAYERSPAGQPRPGYDRALEPLRETSAVLFPANDRKEMERAIRTGAEIDRPVIVYGAQRAWDAADVLRGTSTPVLIDLDWPTPPRDGDPQAEPDLATLRAWEHAPSTPARLHEADVPFALYAGSLSDPGQAMARVRRAIEAGLPEDAALRALTLAPARIFGVADRLGSIETGKIANLVITDGDLFAEGTKIRRVIVDGRPREILESGGGGGRMARADRTDPDSAGADTAQVQTTGAPVAMAVVDGPYRSDRVTLIRDATVMTVTNGTIDGGDVLIRDGRIAAVGQDVRAPADAVVVDGTGMYLTPGIIDAHSHIAADAINEGTVNVSAMVGMRDVIDPDDHAIYRALAGGVTTVNLLHGSANPIGGRNATLKLRWGVDAEDMIFDGAPEGIKFALGENTKRQRNPARYPVTRMGVQDVIREAFLDAQEYMREWEAWERRGRRDRGAVEPRRDLEMETLAQILRGERLVHAHTYRADETLQLLRLAEEMGFTIASFQHILEGYKIADEIAAHGAGASTFSDWWAYKVEAWDAIPHNAALMTERGVVVSINSDDSEEMRHLNQEAAKTMKWGGLSEEQALRLITLNPAIQLGVDDRVGSIEVGKDADLVLFNANPLTIDAAVQQTYVDGNRYFDIELDRARTAAIEQEREALMRKHQPARGGDAAPAASREEVGR